MRKSNAQRQHDYRARHLKHSGEKHQMLERINQMVSLCAKNSLKRLASYYGVTHRAMLERIIAEADNKLINTLTSQQQNDYYDMKITLRSNAKREPLRNELLTG
jgi:hypothetical protein